MDATQEQFYCSTVCDRLFGSDALGFWIIYQFDFIHVYKSLERKHNTVSVFANINIACVRNKLTSVQTVMRTVLAIIFSTTHSRYAASDISRYSHTRKLV